MTDALPTTMRSIAIGEDKTPDSLHIAEAPMPEIGPDEVLVRIAAAGVNRGDCMQRMGLYPAPPRRARYYGLGICRYCSSLGN